MQGVAGSRKGRSFNDFRAALKRVLHPEGAILAVVDKVNSKRLSAKSIPNTCGKLGDPVQGSAGSRKGRPSSELKSKAFQ